MHLLNEMNQRSHSKQAIGFSCQCCLLFMLKPLKFVKHYFFVRKPGPGAGANVFLIPKRGKWNMIELLSLALDASAS